MSDPLLTSIQELRTAVEAQQASICELAKAIDRQSVHLGALVALLAEGMVDPDGEEDRAVTLDGEPLGRPRDQNQGLG